MSADSLWQSALTSFGRSVDIDRDSLAQILERFMVEADGGPVTLPFDLAFAVFKGLQEGKHGRPPNTVLERLEITSVIDRGRKRKAELIASGMPKGKAHERVVQEMSDELGRKHINISPATLHTRLYGNS